MDLLYPEKKDVFDSLVADFTPTKLCPAYALLSSSHPASQIARRIDADVARLEDLCRAMKYERNNCVPMLRLPVEVLGHIIELCARSDPPEQNLTHGHPVPPPPGNRAPGWLGFIRLGHVCGLLRRVILEMSALWATVVTTLPKGRAEILKRARSAPLTIHLDLFQAEPDQITFAETHMSSARVVRMKSGPGQVADSMYDRVKGELIELEELELSVWNMEQDITKDMMDISPLRALRLRRLKLQNHFIPVNYSSLETLVLVFQNTMPIPAEDGHSVFRGHALYDVLSHCTSLRRLYLNGMQFEALPPPSPSRAVIALPFLRYFRMSSTVSFCSSIWSNLALGLHTCVEVTLLSYPENEAESQTISAEEDIFIDELIRRSCELEAPNITGIRLEYRDWDLRLALAVNRVGAFTSECQGPFRENRAFALDLCSRRPYQNAREALFVRLLREIPTHIDLTEVTTLGLSLPHANPIPSFEWRSLLAPFNSVHSLALEEFPPQRALWDALCPPADSTDATFVLPNVRTLFSLPDAPQSVYGYRSSTPDQLVSWEDILAGLGRRAERESGITKLVLGTYWDLAKAVNSWHVPALRSVVPQVVDTREYKDGHLVIPPFDDFSSELWSDNMY